MTPTVKFWSALLVTSSIAVAVPAQTPIQPLTQTPPTPTVPAELASALNAYSQGKYQVAGNALKEIESVNARAAGLVCELFVDKLLPPDEERGSSACATAVRLSDPNGLVWRGLAGHDQYASLGMQITEVSSLGFLASAAELNHVPAFSRLCAHYHSKKQFQEALPFCKYAAGRDSAEGLYYFGVMTGEGQGVVQDNRKSVDSLLLAARMGSAQALIRLAQLSRNGTGGLSQNKVKAYAWVLLASSQESDSRPISDLREAIARELDEAGIADAQKAANAWSKAQHIEASSRIAGQSR